MLGETVRDLDRDRLYALRRRMGMLYQFGALFTDLSVYRNVAFPLREHTALPDELIHDLVMLKLEAVGLRGASRLTPSELSGGMARRVALARAIALDPELIMYDEPFAGLDPISLGVVARLIRRLNDYERRPGLEYAMMKGPSHSGSAGNDRVPRARMLPRRQQLQENRKSSLAGSKMFSQLVQQGRGVGRAPGGRKNSAAGARNSRKRGGR